jgi:hypothetical protein
LREDENAAEPRLQILATMKIVSAKRGGAEDLRLGVSYPRDRKSVAIRVAAKDSDP